MDTNLVEIESFGGDSDSSDQLFNVIAVAAGGVPVALGALAAFLSWHWLPLAIGAGIGIVAAFSPRMAKQWERCIVLRLGRFQREAGPGLFWVLPFLDQVVYWIDLRIRTTGFVAEKTLTRDTVPVDVDAVLFWKVTSAIKAALEVENYGAAVAWAAQTALRDVIGKTDLAEMLVGRETLDHELEALISQRTESWGIQVTSVEIRDVVIPPGLEDAMSKQAQAEREKKARVILGEVEKDIAQKFMDAALTYGAPERAFHLRAMSMVYDGIKERGTLVLVPSSAVDTMGLGGVGAMAMIHDAQARASKDGAPAGGSEKPSLPEA